MIFCTNVNVDLITLNLVFTVYDALMLEHIFAWQFLFWTSMFIHTILSIIKIQKNSFLTFKSLIQPNERWLGYYLVISLLTIVAKLDIIFFWHLSKLIRVFTSTCKIHQMNNFISNLICYSFFHNDVFFTKSIRIMPINIKWKLRVFQRQNVKLMSLRRNS